MLWTPSVQARGKYDITLQGKDLVLSNAKAANIVIPSQAIKRIVVLDNLPDKAKEGKVLVLLSLEPSCGVLNGKTPLDAILIQVNETDELDEACTDGSRLTGVAALVLCQAFGMLGLPPDAFVSPDPDVFQSSRGNPAVRATHKVTPGFLFPLSDSIVFVERPAQLIPHTSISSYELCRAGSPTFDLLLHLRSIGAASGGGGAASSTGKGKAGEGRPPPVELLQIDNAELSRLSSYFATTGIKVFDEEVIDIDADDDADVAAACAKRQLQHSGGGDNMQAEDGDDEDDDSDADDADFDPEFSEDEEGTKKGKLQRRGGGDGAGPSLSPADAEGDDSDEGSSSDEDDDDDVEFVDEEGISAQAVMQTIPRKRKRGEANGGAARSSSGAGSSGAGGSGSGAGPSRSTTGAVSHRSQGQAVIEELDSESEESGEEGGSEAETAEEDSDVV